MTIENDECFDVNVAAQFEEAHPSGIDTQGYYNEQEDITGEDSSLPIFASTVTMNGLKVTIASIIDITEFFLRKDDPYKYVLTGTLNQDLIGVIIKVNKQLFFSNFVFYCEKIFWFDSRC
jgi:hypothetical protein